MHGMGLGAGAAEGAGSIPGGAPRREAARPSVGVRRGHSSYKKPSAWWTTERLQHTYSAMSAPQPQTDTWFQAALRVILRPLARALIRRGVTAPALYQLIKQTYVEVAADEFGLEGAPPTDSRVSVLTGVYRREVKALRAQERDDDAAARKKISVIALVVGRWLASPETTDKTGAPLALARSGPRSFETLVASVSRDVRPRTVLDELLHQGLVTVSGDKETETIALRADALLGSADLEQKMHFFAANLSDHLAAAAANLEEEGPKFLERAVYYNRLKPETVDALEASARALAGEALLSLNREAHQRQRDDAATAEGVERFRFGVYFYRGDESGAPAGTKADGAENNSAPARGAEVESEHHDPDKT